MSPKDLKKIVKEKFGTLNRFADAAGLSRYDLQKSLMKVYRDKPEWKKFREQAGRLCVKTEVQEDPREITPQKREELKRAIEALGGVSKVCEEQGFNRVMVFGILSGKYNGRPMRDTPAVRNIFDYFKIEL